MTCRTWNRLVGVGMMLQMVACCAVIILSDSVNASAAALVWMTIGIPCCFGFLLPED